jgi:hypothetical protein
MVVGVESGEVIAGMRPGGRVYCSTVEGAVNALGDPPHDGSDRDHGDTHDTYDQFSVDVVEVTVSNRNNVVDPADNRASCYGHRYKDGEAGDKEGGGFGVEHRDKEVRVDVVVKLSLRP